MTLVRSHRDLKVYQDAFDAAMTVFEMTKSFPVDERFSLTDQFRRASRSVAANIAEAWHKRRYRAHFISKLTDSSGEAAESQVWAEIALRCNYITEEEFEAVFARLERLVASLIGMINHADEWCSPSKP